MLKGLKIKVFLILCACATSCFTLAQNNNNIAATAIDNAKNQDLRTITTALLKERLPVLQARTTLEVSYSQNLENDIAAYLKRNKTQVLQTMKRGVLYFPLIEERLLANGLPLALKYIPVLESSLNPKAMSPSGTGGFWQFTKQTAINYGLTVNKSVDERMDPIKSTDAVCKYFKALYALYGDWNIAIAAYNAGSGNVSRALKNAGKNPKYSQVLGLLPQSSTHYVNDIHTAMYVYEFAQEHGYILDDSKHITPKPVEVLTNPLSNPNETIEKAVFVPISESSLVHGKHKVAAGENLFRIAQHYKLTVNDLIQWNNLENDAVVIGQLLIIKNEAQTISTDKMRTPIVSYTVQKGDTFWGLARKHGLSIDSIKKMNPQVKYLKPGMILRLS